MSTPEGWQALVDVLKDIHVALLVISLSVAAAAFSLGVLAWRRR